MNVEDVIQRIYFLEFPKNLVKELTVLLDH